MTCPVCGSTSFWTVTCTVDAMPPAPLHPRRVRKCCGCSYTRCDCNDRRCTHLHPHHEARRYQPTTIHFLDTSSVEEPVGFKIWKYDGEWHGTAWR